jgi:hypothetical protein
VPARILPTLALLAVLALACGEKGKAPAPSGPAPGSTVRLSGGADARLFGAGFDRGVVVIADGSDTSAWAPVAEDLAQSGYGVLVLPFAESAGTQQALAAARELEGRGAQRIVFVGSGRGTTAALAAAAGGAAGVAVLNPPADFGAPPAAVPPVPSLTMASLADGGSSAVAQQLYRAAPEPRILALYPAREAAPAAFTANSELKSTFLDFLRNAFQPLSA